MMFLSGTFFPVSAMPDFVQTIAKVLPLYYLANGLRDTIVRDQGFMHVLPEIGVLLGVTAVLAAIVAAHLPLGVRRPDELARFENVIVGGGLAGGMIAQEYREQGGDGRALIVASEQHTAVPPPAADQGVPARREAGRQLAMHPADWWREQNVELRLGTEVRRWTVAAPHDRVDGETIEFGRLALATGSTPRPLRGRRDDPHDRGLRRRWRSCSSGAAATWPCWAAASSASRPRPAHA